MLEPSRPQISLWSLIAAISSVLILLSYTTLASAETPDELRQQRKQVQADEALAATEVDLAAGDASEVQGALDAMQHAVDAQIAAVEAAQRGVAQAEDAIVAASARVDNLKARLETATETMQAQAIEAYVGFQGPASDLAMLDSDPWQQARETALVEFATGSNLDALDDLRTIGAELEAQTRLAAEAGADAQRRTDDLRGHLSALAEARDNQTQLVDEANARVDDKLSELAALQTVDAELASEIRSEEQKIADAIAARSRPSTYTYDIPDNLQIELTRVRGINVNVIIANQLEGLLAAMSAAGYTLGGGGYRSPQSQIDLRRRNCGTSDYAIWRMPARNCRPPTAPPGRSDHERGLAIDFTVNGRAIRSRSSGVFNALVRLAPDFGFKNLPSEPWHWSVTGS